MKLFWRHFSVPLVLLSTPGTSSFGGTNCFLCPFCRKEVCGASPCTQNPTDFWTCRPIWVKRGRWGLQEAILFLHVLCQGLQRRDGPHLRSFFSKGVTPFTLRQPQVISFFVQYGKTNAKHFFPFIFRDPLNWEAVLAAAGPTCFYRSASFAPHALHAVRGQGKPLKINPFLCSVVFVLYFSFHTRMRTAVPCGNESLTKNAFLKQK